MVIYSQIASATGDITGFTRFIAIGMRKAEKIIAAD
jgi:hypothetical protein